ncbi:nitroreductase family protein [Bordetella genomosp. 5]|uniref:NADPH-dependent oxidoreductase n=1 Tax=Bordetella genomosp. 5 TaxID=1395608 RepID=A0A261U138_9BORD|nr:nitroreductase family protein [Bordetella genomosp. 5]OZI55207.1 NADPH-dependent oxidoreductase [Bordetella genomosp. 5]
MDREAHHAALLAARYGNQPKPQHIHWTSVVEQQLAHKSVRTFLNHPLPEGTLDTMVAAAQSASTSSALHLWSVVAVTDKAMKQRISDTIAATVPTDRIPWIEEAPALLLWVADASRSATLTQEHGEDPVVLEHLDSFLMSSIDTTLAAQNAALAAESMGLGIVFLGVMRNAAKQVAELLGLPPYTFVAFGMAVGKPDPARASAARPRMPPAAVLHHNGFQKDRYRAYLDGYEAAYLKFRQEQNMKPKSWQSSVREAATSMSYMGGREHLREMVTEQGFKLR